jgi:hypothetical protein
MAAYRELSWADIKRVKELVQCQHQDCELGEIAGMVYLLADADCVDVVTKKLKEISKFDSSQLVLSTVYDTLPSSIQKRILGRILASRQAIMLVEKIYKNRTGHIHEDIVRLWGGLSIIVNYPNNPIFLDYNQVYESMDFIVNYFSQIKEKAKGITDFNDARLVVIESIRETFSITRLEPECDDFSILKIASTRKISPVTLIHFYILSLAFAIKGSTIFCIEDTPCLRLSNGYFYISNFPDYLFATDSAKTLLDKHGIDNEVLYKESSETDFVMSLLLRFYRNGLIRKNMYKIVKSALKHYNANSARSLHLL